MVYQIKDNILDEYYDHHHKKYCDGKVSAMSGIEHRAIEIFLMWLLTNYNVRHK